MHPEEEESALVGTLVIVGIVLLVAVALFVASGAGAPPTS